MKFSIIAIIIHLLTISFLLPPTPIMVLACCGAGCGGRLRPDPRVTVPACNSPACCECCRKKVGLGSVSSGEPRVNSCEPAEEPILGEASNGELESPLFARQQQRDEAAPKFVGEFFKGRWSML